MTSKVKYGPCNNQLYNAAIEILTECTGKKWGFMQFRRKVSYAVCEELGLKIGSGTKVAYKIKTKAIGAEWKQNLRLELCIMLADYCARNGVKFPYDCKTRDGANLSDLLEAQIDVSKCTPVDTYQDTFIHASTDWIVRENIFESEKELSPEDYI